MTRPRLTRTREDDFFSYAVIGAAIAGAMLVGAVVAIAGVA